MTFFSLKHCLNVYSVVLCTMGIGREIISENWETKQLDPGLLLVRDSRVNEEILLTLVEFHLGN